MLTSNLWNAGEFDLQFSVESLFKPVNGSFLFKPSITHVLSIYHVDVYVILCLE